MEVSMAEVGSLHVTLGADTAQFTDAMRQAQKELAAAGKQMQALGKSMAQIGQRMSLAITAPIAALGVVSVKTAANFEGAMKKVEISTKAPADQIEAMGKKARQLGKDGIFGATQAAEGMDMLAKNGLSASQILGGAAEATVDLAAAADSELEPAAAAVTDTMSVFGKTAAELPQVVNQITGAVNLSKFAFADFQGGMAQAGARAAGLGVNFEDFTAVLAGTASQFASGSDAGTSFGTFIQRLKPASKEAEAAIAALGLQFYTSSGQLRPMAEIAEELRVKVGALNGEAKNEALTKIFGSDAIRTALGLMAQGADGLQRLQKEIAATDAAAQAAKRMEGFNGQLEQLKGAAEELAIVLGESGLLAAMTGLVQGLTGLLDALGNVHPSLAGVALALAAVAAAIGPLLIFVGNLIIAKGALATAMAGAAGKAGLLAGAMRVLAASFAFLTGPWGLLILGVATAVGVLIAKNQELSPAQRQTAATTEALAKATDEYKSAALLAANASDKDRDSAIQAAKAKRALMEQALRTAQAQVREAQATVALSRARLAATTTAINDPVNADARTRSMLGQVAGDQRRNVQRETADLEARSAALKNQATDLAAFETSLARPIATGNSSGTGTLNIPDNVRTKKEGGGRSGPTPADLRLQAQIEIARARGDEATAQRLEDQADLKQRIAAYDEAGLGKAGARAAAERDMGELQAARTEAAESERFRMVEMAEIAAARLAMDEDQLRTLERETELADLIERYMSTKLSRADAVKQALIDQSIIEEGRAAGQKIRLEEMQLELDIQVAQIAGETQLVDLLQRRVEGQRRIKGYQQEGKGIVDATVKAEADLVAIDRARAQAREKWLSDRRTDHALRLAELRGEEGAVKRLRREAEIAARTEQLKDQRYSPEEAGRRARIEIGEEDFARAQGQWREIVRGGTRAAFEGDLKGFLEERLADATARGLQRGADKLADWAFQFAQKTFPGLFPGLGEGLIGAGEAAGEAAGSTAAATAITTAGAAAATSITTAGATASAALSTAVTAASTALGAVGATVSGAITSSGMAVAAAIMAAATAAGASNAVGGIPGFKTGGSFTVGGRGGIDQNLVQFRATRGERVDISTPGQLRAGGGVQVIRVQVDKSKYFDVAVQSAAAPMAAQAAMAGARGGAALAQQDISRRRRNTFS
jgi:TP901 family phage tail tape measure protein